MSKCKVVLARVMSVILIVTLIGTFSILDVTKILGVIEVQAAPVITADEAMDLIEKQKGKYLDYDGVEGAQCVDLIKYYYKILGASPVSGDAIDYKNNTLPSGWTRLWNATPQKGDILIYTGGTYGHVGIYKSNGDSYHQNIKPLKYINIYNYDSFGTLTYWGVIRPDFIKIDRSYQYFNGSCPYAYLKATAAAGETYTWSSSNEKVAKVRADGFVYATGSGRATITATTSSGNVATCSIISMLYK